MGQRKGQLQKNLRRAGEKFHGSLLVGERQGSALIISEQKCPVPQGMSNFNGNYRLSIVAAIVLTVCIVFRATSVSENFKP